MPKLTDALVAMTEARYNTRNGVRVHASDPRHNTGFSEAWNKTYDWFPWRTFADGEAKLVLWGECGYGHYALTRGDVVLGMGKDVVNTEEYTVIGECASQDGEVYVAKNLTRVA